MSNSDNSTLPQNTTLPIALSSKPAIIIIIALCCIGILLFLFGTWFAQSSPKSSVSTDTLYSTAAAGYIIATVSIICLIIFMFINASTSNNFKTFINTIPALITQIVLIFAAVQILIFKSKLVNHSIADTYYKNNMNFSILLLFQLILLWFFFFSTIQNNLTSLMKINLKYFLYVLGIINLLLLGINQCILQFYSTDG